MNKRFLSVSVSALLICSMALAGTTGTVSQVTTKQGPVIKTVFTWTSDATNDCAIGTGTVKISGEVLRVVFNPLPSLPTSYTVTMKDQNGIDLLVGAGTSMTTNAVTSIRPAIVMASGITTNLAPLAVNDLFTISVTNCGVSKYGTITVYSK